MFNFIEFNVCRFLHYVMWQDRFINLTYFIVSIILETDPRGPTPEDADVTGEAREVSGAPGRVTDHTYAGANSNLDSSVPPANVPSGSQQPTGATGSNQEDLLNTVLLELQKYQNRVIQLETTQQELSVAKRKREESSDARPEIQAAFVSNPAAPERV